MYEYMAELYGENLNRQELMKRVGDISQVAGARKYQISEGKGKGVEVIQVKTGSGFEFTVIPDRGLDIAYAGYKGMPISFISKTGITSPFSFEEPGDGFLRSFYAGLLTTCGLTYFGPSCKDGEEELGLHGRATSILADDVCIIQDWVEDDFMIKIRGKMRQSVVFGENILLTREIRTSLGSNKVEIIDEVENQGFDPQPLMLLYHCNFGYPIVSSVSEIRGDFLRTTAKDSEAEKGMQDHRIFEDPIHEYKEQVFFHKMKADENNYGKVSLINNNLNLGIYVKYDMTTLPNLIEWKQMGEGDYVVGLEPSTWYPLGRNIARERNELEYIQPFEKKKFSVEIGMEIEKDM